MSRIMLCEDRAFAPCCYIIARQRPDGTFDCRDEANTVLIQTDWDYPGVASTFGWSLSTCQWDVAAPLYAGRCDHPGTDGTVKCDECGLTAGDFIDSARMYLDEHLGAVADDPGYFS